MDRRTFAILALKARARSLWAEGQRQSLLLGKVFGSAQTACTQTLPVAFFPVPDFFDQQINSRAARAAKLAKAGLCGLLTFV